MLTQRDVDALFQGASTRTEAPPVVVPFNFVRPPRLPRPRQAAVGAVYERFALTLQGLLSTRLRTPCDVTVRAIEQVPFAEFTQAIGAPCAAFAFRFSADPAARGVFDLGIAFAYFLVDRLFGGPGENAPPERPLTALEQVAARGVAERALNLLAEAWREHVAMQPEIESFESNPETLLTAARDDSVLVAHLEVRSGDFAGLATVCLPVASLGRFLQEVVAPRSGTPSLAAADRAALSQALLPAHVEVAARLPVFGLSAREVAALRPGDVLHTGLARDAAVEVRVNGRLHFSGVLGQSRRRLALRITQRISVPSARRVALVQGRVS